MDKLINEFAVAHSEGNGYKVAQTFLPISPPDQLDRLYSIWKCTNQAAVKRDVTRAMRKSDYVNRLTSEEFTGWAEILTCYWKAVSEIVPITAEIYDGRKARNASFGYLASCRSLR